MNSAASTCGCTIVTRNGKSTTCTEQSAANSIAGECYLHEKYILGLTAPNRGNDTLDGRSFTADDDVVEIENRHGKTRHFA